jgi:hypothetical protein
MYKIPLLCFSFMMGPGVLKKEGDLRDLWQQKEKGL